MAFIFDNLVTQAINASIAQAIVFNDLRFSQRQGSV
jgi:hypothetical protein